MKKNLEECNMKNELSEKNRKLLDEALKIDSWAGMGLPIMKNLIRSYIGDDVSDDDVTEMAIRMVTKPMINMYSIPASKENVTNADEFIDNIDKNTETLLEVFDKNNVQPLWNSVDGLYFIDKDIESKNTEV
jgi:hypothetical protein